MDLVVQAALVGLLQGLTEFIPISSSAHLELAPWIAGWETDGLVGSLAFDVFLHLGTLVALVIYFFRDWLRYIGAWLASVRERRIDGDPDRRIAWLLILATIPAGIIGFALEGFIEESLHGDNDGARLAIAGFLVVGATALLLADRLGRRERRMEELSTASALTIGFSQALALLPGISRSGATITAITFGAGLYGSRRLFDEPLSSNEWLAIGVGFVVAAASGLLAIGFLLAWLRRRSVAVFSLYRIGFAAVIVILVLVGR
jgi:undecaprenyl-diphosphatase